jgi:hypothetical protein
MVVLLHASPVVLLVLLLAVGFKSHAVLTAAAWGIWFQVELIAVTQGSEQCSQMASIAGLLGLASIASFLGLASIAGLLGHAKGDRGHRGACS